MSTCFRTAVVLACSSLALLASTSALAVNQLVYTPLPQPCRLLDTRAPGPGPFTAAHGQYLLGIGDADIKSAAQHGESGGCNIPVNATAISANFNIFNATAAGNLSTWASTASKPAAGTAVYNPTVAPPAPGQVDYNTGFATISVGWNDARFYLAVANGAVDMTINVVGYWTALSNGSTSTTAINVGSFNTASGDYATAIGELVTASGANAQAFGYQNTASGLHSIALGNLNTASADYSMALGTGANTAGHFGAFVYSRDTTSSTADYQFMVRAKGGYVFYTGTDTTTGVQLPAGSGAWTSLSDRNAKDAVTAIDGRDVLDRVAAMPLATWHYKTQDAKYRHMGPMAQDFYAAFGLGESDTGIDTIDADGVALAAIQGLKSELDEKDRIIEAHTRELADTHRKLAELSARMAELSASSRP